MPRPRWGGPYGGYPPRRPRRTEALATATTQTGAIVMTKGRRVSLAEFELRSKARKTSTVPYKRTMNATATPAGTSHLMDYATGWSGVGYGGAARGRGHAVEVGVPTASVRWAGSSGSSSLGRAQPCQG